MMTMNKKMKGILVGCLLGDAHIGKLDRGKAFITFEQSIKHKDYIHFLHSVLKVEGITCQELKHYSRKDNRYEDKINESIYFKTHNLESSYYLAKMFLQDNNKIVPKDIKQHLSPIALGYWICDDGQLVKNGGITLCTDKFTLAEVNLLIEALASTFELKCTIHRKKGKGGRGI